MQTTIKWYLSYQYPAIFVSFKSSLIPYTYSIVIIWFFLVIFTYIEVHNV